MEEPVTVDLTEPLLLDVGKTVQPEVDLRNRLDVGEPVEILSRFDQRWTHGFLVEVVESAMVQVRRLSDDRVLPAWFPASMIRPAALR